LYTPPAFNEDRLPVLHDAIRQARLAVLVTMGADGLEASHVPLLLDPTDGPQGTLVGHMARANPQWRRPAPGVEALAVFSLADAYVTPAWYTAKRQTGQVVPTWNYVAVHAYGPLEFIEDPAQLKELVTRLTDRHEAARPEPWAVSDAPEAFIDAMVKGIVGFRLPITRLEGKWKLGQNRSAEDQAAVRHGLLQSDDPADVALGRQMRDHS
jgi:transcriptional regulator